MSHRRDELASIAQRQSSDEVLELQTSLREISQVRVDLNYLFTHDIPRVLGVAYDRPTHGPSVAQHRGSEWAGGPNDYPLHGLFTYTRAKAMFSLDLRITPICILCSCRLAKPKL